MYNVFYGKLSCPLLQWVQHNNDINVLHAVYMFFTDGVLIVYMCHCTPLLELLCLILVLLTIQRAFCFEEVMT